MVDRVLVVDDEADAVRTFRDLLESAGYEVATASCGEEALTGVQKARPDAILLDIMMPGRDGLDIARALAGDPDTARIPVVMMTAHHSYPVGPGLWAAPNIHRILYKPCRTRTLLEVLSDALQSRS